MGDPVRKADDGAAEATVLLVDDEPAVLGVMRRVLERAGHRVLPAEDGLVALELFRAHQAEIDCVVLDVSMPRLSGEETFRRLRELSAEVPVLLASGFGGLEASGQFAALRPAGYLEKPFNAPTLLGRIRELIVRG